jgi:hypothetical protein
MKQGHWAESARSPAAQDHSDPFAQCAGGPLALGRATRGHTSPQGMVAHDAVAQRAATQARSRADECTTTPVARRQQR